MWGHADGGRGRGSREGFFGGRSHGMLGEVSREREDGWMKEMDGGGEVLSREEVALYSPSNNQPLHLLRLMFWFRLM